MPPEANHDDHYDANPDEKRMAHITDIQVKHAEHLMHKANVIGVGVGLIQKNGETLDEVGLVVMVTKKLPLDDLDTEDVVPRFIDDVRLDVQETGPFVAGAST